MTIKRLYEIADVYETRFSAKICPVSHFREVVTLVRHHELSPVIKREKVYCRHKDTCALVWPLADALHMVATDFCDKQKRKSRWCTFVNHNLANVNFLHLLRRRLLVL